MGEPQGLPPAVVPEVLLPPPTPDLPLPLVQHLCGGEGPSCLPSVPHPPDHYLVGTRKLTHTGPVVAMKPLQGLLKAKGGSNAQPLLVTHAVTAFVPVPAPVLGGWPLPAQVLIYTGAPTSILAWSGQKKERYPCPTRRHPHPHPTLADRRHPGPSDSDWLKP